MSVAMKYNRMGATINSDLAFSLADSTPRAKDSFNVSESQGLGLCAVIPSNRRSQLVSFR